VSRGRLTRGSLAAAATAAVGVTVAGQTVGVSLPFHRERHPQQSWAACNANARNDKASTFRPLSDSAAAALVTPEPETRPYNARAYTLDGRAYPGPNEYVPTTRQAAAFRNTKGSTGETNVEFNPYYAYVDGRDGMRQPSTDDLIQWAAHKWGIPEDWLRAEYARESYWNQFNLGDETQVAPRAYRAYPSQSRLPHGSAVYQSLGITQIRWVPDGSLHWGTEPLRWLSTAFNVDYQAATLRFYYDNPQGTRSAWGDASYQPCQKWNSIGAWYRPYPWGNTAQATYVRGVQQNLAARNWTSASFQQWTPASSWRGIHFGR
jgi:hypothetical protein